MNEFSRPHYTKITACLNNPRLPESDRERLEEAIIKYRQWIIELESINSGQADAVEKLVSATNRYKRFIELDLIFDSSDNFLYRQKGQLKLDNTILEEFLPQHELIESHLGYVCAECKTNLDKTMFQEAVATSRDLKIAVPNSLYFLICEFIDMTPVSIISTQIDDVLIIRKTKRIPANLRQEYRSSKARQLHRQEYVDFLDASQYYPDVFQRMIDKIQTHIDNTNPSLENVLYQGYF